ncbi:amino acid adenylation domain-containing protein [Chamaesiphon sp. VAR_48_metabat_135_sub]|uniref:non-ribosomal peptide synthetase n=1 Tax=Chamaesiphon sp. VAR_48_metabat_135_sub TaxID=2964699 RepID=UPI00286CC7DD|nr:amino acid adenylation domain-containing protein [Chamaesiphon sp. VAR_48_metabat_135_sub]
MNINSNSIDSQSKLIAIDFDPFADGELLLTAPATPSQTEIWLSVQMGDAANCAYNLSQSFRLNGSLDRVVLASALQQLVARHESLRTTFSSNGESLCIVADLRIEIPTIDLTALSPPERDLQLTQIVKQDLNQPFKIEQGPLFRAQIIELADREHLLLLTAHHIICDGWSWTILIEDLGALYSAQAQGITPNLPIAEKFSDYASAEIAAAQQPEAIETEQYWLAQFADSVPVVDFPTDRPRPPLRTFNAAREDYDLDLEVGEQLKQLGQKFGCSFTTMILAGFEVLLHRLTGQTDLVVGIPSCGQVATGQDRLVGHCTNLLPLRTQIDGKQPFTDYLQQRRSTILDAYEHQQFTFGSLVGKLALPRDLSRIPLVPIMFNLDRAAVSNRSLFNGLELSSHLNSREFETFELFINAVELTDKIVLECQYNTNLFDRATIRRRMSEFETLLRGIVAHPEQLISQLPLLTTAARQQLLIDWNATQADYPDTKCLHQLVAAQVELTPDAVAVVDAGQQLTYAELDIQANQVANYLIDLGVQTETFVGICVERSLAMVVGLLGILKAGAAYVPIDPNYPLDRIEYMLQDAQINVLLTQQPLINRLPTQIENLVCLDTDWQNIARTAKTATQVKITPDHIAYLIYTSGSTGKPKGVEVLHRGVVNFLTSMQQQPGMTATDILLSVTTLSFDIAVLEIFLPITVGARVVLLSREDAMDGQKLAATIAEAGITMMQATPSTWRLLLEAEWAGNRNLKILSGGEAITSDVAAQLLAKSGEVWNMYGPTETTIWSTVYQITGAEQRISIGRPIANTEIYILDDELQPVPIGIAGSLYIGGAGLAKGYWQQPTLTNDKFIPHPFSHAPARIYQTGDLARYLPDGNIECLGRADFQVKLRGFRIELGEIEALLCQHPTIARSTAIIREDLPGDRRLVAYIVANPQSLTAPVPSELRQFLQQKLPDYFLPAAIVTLPSLPLTPNGKIDLKALPVPDSTSFQLQTSFVAPTTPTEITLAQIWIQVLRIDKVGTNDDFFELGGHSLLATQVISRARQAFAIDIPLQSLFEQPTIAGLASRIDTSIWFKDGSQESSAEMEEIEI